MNLWLSKNHYNENNLFCVLVKSLSSASYLEVWLSVSHISCHNDC